MTKSALTCDQYFATWHGATLTQTFIKKKKERGYILSYHDKIKFIYAKHVNNKKNILFHFKHWY